MNKQEIKFYWTAGFVIYICFGFIFSIINTTFLNETCQDKEIVQKFEKNQIRLSYIIILSIICIAWPYFIPITLKQIKKYIYDHKQKKYDENETLQWIKNHPQFYCKKKNVKNSTK